MATPQNTDPSMPQPVSLTMEQMATYTKDFHICESTQGQKRKKDAIEIVRSVTSPLSGRFLLRQRLLTNVGPYFKRPPDGIKVEKAVNKLKLNQLESVKKEVCNLSDSEKVQLKSHAQNKKLCIDKSISKGLPLSNSNVVVKKEAILDLPEIENDVYTSNNSNLNVIPNEEVVVVRITTEPKDSLSETVTTQNKSNINSVSSLTPSTLSSVDTRIKKEPENSLSESPMWNNTTSIVTTESSSIKNEYNSESVINELTTTVKKEPEDLDPKSVSMQNNSESDIMAHSDSIHTKSNQNTVSEVITKIKNESEDLVSKTGRVSPELFHKEMHSDLKEKQEPIDNAQHDRKETNSFGTSNMKVVFIDNNDTISNLEQSLSSIKSEPSEVSNPKKDTNLGLSKGANALRDRLSMYKSRIGIKQEPIECKEMEENANNPLCNTVEKNKDATGLCHTHSDENMVEANSEKKTNLMQPIESDNVCGPIAGSDELHNNKDKTNYDYDSLDNPKVSTVGESNNTIISDSNVSIELTSDKKCSIRAKCRFAVTDISTETHTYLRNWKGFLVPQKCFGLLKGFLLKMTVVRKNYTSYIDRNASYIEDGTVVNCLESQIGGGIPIQFDAFYCSNEARYIILAMWVGDKPYFVNTVNSHPIWVNSSATYYIENSTEYYLELDLPTAIKKTQKYELTEFQDIIGNPMEAPFLNGLAVQVYANNIIKSKVDEFCLTIIVDKSIIESHKSKMEEEEKGTDSINEGDIFIHTKGFIKAIHRFQNKGILKFNQPNWNLPQSAYFNIENMYVNGRQVKSFIPQNALKHYLNKNKYLDSPWTCIVEQKGNTERKMITVELMWIGCIMPVYHPAFQNWLQQSIEDKDEDPASIPGEKQSRREEEQKHLDDERRRLEEQKRAEEEQSKMEEQRLNEEEVRQEETCRIRQEETLRKLDSLHRQNEEEAHRLEEEGRKIHEDQLRIQEMAIRLDQEKSKEEEELKKQERQCRREEEQKHLDDERRRLEEQKRAEEEQIKMEEQRLNEEVVRQEETRSIRQEETLRILDSLNQNEEEAHRLEEEGRKIHEDQLRIQEKIIRLEQEKRKEEKELKRQLENKVDDQQLKVVFKSDDKVMHVEINKDQDGKRRGLGVVQEGNKAPEAKPKTAKKDPVAKAKVSKKKKAASTYDVVLEAIKSVTDHKGCTVDKIKKFYLAKYPEKNWTRVKTLVKKALEKGLEEGLIIRPKAAEGMTGLMGRFKIDKNFLKQNNLKVKKTAGAAEVKPKGKHKKDESQKPKATKTKPTTRRKAAKENKKLKKAKAKAEAAKTAKAK